MPEDYDRIIDEVRSLDADELEELSESYDEVLDEASDFGSYVTGGGAFSSPIETEESSEFGVGRAAGAIEAAMDRCEDGYAFAEYLENEMLDGDGDLSRATVTVVKQTVPEALR